MQSQKLYRKQKYKGLCYVFMKKPVLFLLTLAVIIGGCATMQSIVRSTFPYTASLIVPSSASTNEKHSASSPASSFDQIFTGQGTNTSMIKEVRMASAKLEAGNPSNQNLGVFSSVKLYLSRGDGSGEVLAAERNDVSPNAGSSIVLDIDNSKFLDDILKGSTVKVRMEYVLRNKLSADASFKAVLGFTTSPDTNK